MRTLVRLAVGGWLIYEVSHGKMWALIDILILQLLGHEALAALLKKRGIQWDD